MMHYWVHDVPLRAHDDEDQLVLACGHEAHDLHSRVTRVTVALSAFLRTGFGRQASAVGFPSRNLRKT